MASKKVQVVVKATGKKQWVPERFLDHPVLGRGIELPPSVLAASDLPNEHWRKDRIAAYAAEHDIDLTEASTKAGMVAAIEAALAALELVEVDTTTNPDATPASDETPATGDEE